MICVSNFLSHIYDNLGNRFDILNAPGFIRTYKSELFQLAIIIPIVIETAKHVFENQYHKICSKNTDLVHKVNYSDPQEIIPTEYAVNNVTLSERPILSQPAKQDSNGVSFPGQEKFINIRHLLSINKYSLINNFVNILKQNSIAFLTSFTLLTLFTSFKEIPQVVYPGYAAILFGHSFKVIEAYQYKSRYDLTKHILSSIITVSTLVAMGSGIYAIRWHHMSYGLLCLLFDFRNINFLGSCMAADSMLYWLRPLKDNYDFSNIFTDNLTAFIFQLTSLTLYEISKRMIRTEPAICDSLV